MALFHDTSVNVIIPEDAEKPRIYSCCGTEDTLYPINVGFRDFMMKTDFDYTYDEGPGAHTWSFWDKWVRRAIKWMLGVQ